MKTKLSSQNNVLRKIPEILLQDLEPQSTDLELNKDENVWLIAVGKGALKMAADITQKYRHQIEDGIVISPYSGFVTEQVQVFKGSHPIPDSDTVAASYEVKDFVQKIPSGDTLIFCISGGASSMLMIPPFGIEIEEICQLYSLLLKSGASIDEMNIVRKHVCDLKGGKLAEEINHLKLISVIESDVPGDSLTTIGSGPTIPDPSTFVQAVQILKNLNIWNLLPITIQEHLICGVEGYIPENPKPELNEHPDHKIKLLSGLDELRNKVSSLLKNEGYNVFLNEAGYSGTVQEVAKQICSKAISTLSSKSELKKPAALIYFGESTVKIRGEGKGGRNQELALMAALSFEGQHAISMLSIDTDGIDGPTDVAGAIVDSNTTLMARKNKIEPEKFLITNNSYEFHKQAGTHIKTGSTGINLMDLQIVLIN
ncbi:MAG: DUF4147 domain-containing protein [Balneola sp.]|nr:DUF4147 domain-containing protein [Balneola sp.]MBO6651957.1 DUF4147 domain-containing protein [Balneola sp.]MBO6711792.1 DUF4147 domain-containing protein [Balneola sp.]MBO6799986.1 DUF4147 domain-containing protein [Balneola sp.]MBO6871231.1 DUF4147 domain-containing protein [Balneola sp.]